MRRAGSLAIAAASVLVSSSISTAAWAAEPKVVVTIKPLHALVTQVMSGVGAPELLVKGATSPHSYTLKPSEARSLNNADLFFRMSETVESFTTKVAKSLPKSVARGDPAGRTGHEALGAANGRDLRAAFPRQGQGARP